MSEIGRYIPEKAEFKVTGEDFRWAIEFAKREERDRVLKLIKAVYPNEVWTSYIEKIIDGDFK